MAKPYRRKKNGKLVGSYRVGIDGRDVNLETKDASEAHRRAALAAKGKWPVLEAAAAEAAAALDPTKDRESSGEAVPPEVLAGGGPQPTPSESPPPPAAASYAPAPPSEPLEAAAAAAAAEISGAEAAEQVTAEQANVAAEVDSKLAAVMAELTGGAGGNDVLGGLAQMAADLVLSAEKKTLEWGGTWALKRRGQRAKLVASDPPELMRKSLTLGLHGYALVHFPDFASKLTPGWAIVLGLVGGAGGMMAGASIVKLDDAAATPAPEAAPAASAA